MVLLVILDYVAQFKGILKLKGYQNIIIGSKVMAILLRSHDQFQAPHCIDQHPPLLPRIPPKKN